ncbi:MAG TPA: sugar transferase [Burkholderiaceae bacterium]|jgi:exopolysaccharide biosynthesis polyprenyl glycosylphosphotransferase|nr:sugar transferase [Burkholderiaceae bacterium]HRA78757.1 sugar transferase [Burkholderiaceae bacterium]
MKTKFRRRLALLGFLVWDVVIAALAFVLAGAFLEFGPPPWPLSSLRTPEPLVFVAVCLLVWHITLIRLKLYDSRRLGAGVGELRDLIVGVMVMVAFMAIAAILFAPHLADRNFMVPFAIVLTALSIVARLVLRRFLARLRARGHNLRFVIVAGSGRRALSLQHKFASEPSIGYRVAGFVDDEVVGRPPPGAPHLGTLDDLPRLLSQNVVDEVFVALPIKSCYGQIQRIVANCEAQGVPVTMLTDLFALRLARTHLTMVGNIPALRLCDGPEFTQRVTIKRYVDFALAALGVLALSPLLLAVAVLIKLTSPGPVIFAQTRVGLNKRLFRLYKFRTMVAEAEIQQAGLESMNEASGPVFKIRNDPRVTPFGRFLRRTSIDELPQLLNVLKGDMSLVGPRPLPLRDVSGFRADWQRRRFSVLPGMTCLWQLNGRSDVSFERWMELDLEYIDNWSLARDFAILVRTAQAVLSGKGAY